ncbi:hypothetical protein RclHR1_04780006 [Rhizophagus clarus]|uniref:Kinase-like domain-containing protein n=1 Tax=Rhizophagus clarus TaxID=94130 RepID=A0A2Z6SD47_9GLOM|nr:hypothetical protein RclHR1_04780006 [Rhizophagus clarus]GES87926.1 kinase-like domain-containing protein [Rhizophagus clarus]
MSNNAEIKVICNPNEWINWIKESITKKQIKHYDFKHFNNIQEIDSGNFGKVYRANWKNSHGYLTLKSITNFDVIAKEVVNELKLWREVDFHENIIRFYGITTEEDNSKEYLLVMEHADSGTLRNYLSDHFKNLTWNDKLNLAFQLVNAISFLHNEEIVHRYLHSNNILVHKNTIKLADFGLSKRIKELFNSQLNLFEMVAYVDPQIFNKKRDSNNQLQIYSLDKTPFCNGSYDIDLAIEILQGLREKPIPDTPEDYIKVYADCWNNEPNNRPTINQLVTKLNTIVSNFQHNNFNLNVPLSSKQLLKPNIEISEYINDNNNLHEKICQIIQNFSRINMKELEPSISLKNTLDIMINEIILLLDDTGSEREKHIIDDYCNNHSTTSQEIYDWLLNNQDKSNSVFLLGLFNYLGIETNIDRAKAFILYQKAANSGNIYGMCSLGSCYEFGIGTSINEHKAFELYHKVANLGNLRGINNLGRCYNYGIGTYVNKQKAFELYQKAASLGSVLANISLGYCYLNGFGTNVDNIKAFEIFQDGANLGDNAAQYNLAYVYEYGIGIKKNINQAIYWYKKSAEQGDKDARNKVNKFNKKKK